jgi:hypothetical protein
MGSMVKWNVTRPDLWQEVSPKRLELITNKTFAHVAKFVSICCILALVAIEDMEIHQMDVKTAFLNGDLEEEMYIEQPTRFTQKGEHFVCKLHKSLYGLK